MLSLPVWPGRDGAYAVTPLDVLAQPQEHAREFVRLMRADTAYPIDITRHDGRWVVLDGMHRLAKLYRDGTSRVQVRVVPNTHLIPRR